MDGLSKPLRSVVVDGVDRDGGLALGADLGLTGEDVDPIGSAVDTLSLAE